MKLFTLTLNNLILYFFSINIFNVFCGNTASLLKKNQTELILYYKEILTSATKITCNIQLNEIDTQPSSFEKNIESFISISEKSSEYKSEVEVQTFEGKKHLITGYYLKDHGKLFGNIKTFQPM
jgi:lipopolysaccharide biosynthesis regulator YciM